jgi:hypothetical protein
MSRTLGDIPFGKGFPPKGKHCCTVLDATKGKSKNKGTPQITLLLSNGETEFTDDLYVTEKTLGRLCLVAKRVCGMPDDFQLPDNDLDASNEVARFIMSNVCGKNCVVTIEENDETFIPTDGPDIGRPVTRKRKRVSFNGYDVSTEPQPESGEQTEQPTNDEELPF